MEKRKRCYIYTRVSTDIQIDGYSLDAQKEKLFAYAKYQNLSIAGEYCDAGKSGKNTAGRPDFQRMMKDIQDGNKQIDFILVFKLSRFGRNAADVLASLQTMQDYGTNLICVEDNIDSSKDSGKLMIAVLSAVAEIERENILIQTMAGRRQKAKEGKWNGGQAPYGYTLDNGMLVINPEEAEIVKMIYKDFNLHGVGYNKIAKWLNDNGYKRTPHKNLKYERFTAKFVKDVLENPVYAGYIVYGRRTREKVQGKRNEYKIKNNDMYELYKGQHEAIISKELWESAQERWEATGYIREKKYDVEHEHILSGLLRCPKCGAPMYGSVNRKKKKDGTYYKACYYYVCKNRKSQQGVFCDFKRQPQQAVIDQEVLAVIYKVLTSPNFYNDMANHISKSADESEAYEKMDELKKLRQQYIFAKDRLAKSMDTLDYLDPLYETKYSDMEKRLNQLYDDISGVDDSISYYQYELDEIQNVNNRIHNLKVVQEELKSYAEEFHTLNDWQKKDLIQTLVLRVDIFPERQPDGRWVKSIDFNFPIDYDGEVIDHWSPKESTVETVVLMSRADT